MAQQFERGVATETGLTMVCAEGTVAAIHAERLAAAYNEFAELLGNTVTMTASDVIAFFDDLRSSGGWPWLFFRNGLLVADGDLRNICDGECELALTVLDRANHRTGLGRAVVYRLEHVATQLGITRARAEILAHNVASRGLFQSLGYALDPTESTAEQVVMRRCLR